MRLRQQFARLVLKLIGWQVKADFPAASKLVIIGAPHTTNWDLPLAILLFWYCDRRLTWAAKKQVFRPPFGILLKALGGIPVDRTAPQGLTGEIADQFAERDTMYLGITPEGTRSRTEHWKTGFYYIARQAQVPICFGYADFPRRTLGIAPGFIPGGDIAADFDRIAAFYADKTGKFPQLQGPVRLRPQVAADGSGTATGADGNDPR